MLKTIKKSREFPYITIYLKYVFSLYLLGSLIPKNYFPKFLNHKYFNWGGVVRPSLWQRMNNLYMAGIQIHRSKSNCRI
jgi:hypothetical protein